MLYILNAKERNQAFMQFLILFLFTLALIVGALYFNMKMPVKQNQLLTDEIYQKQEEDIHQQRFVNRMTEVRQYLDSLEKSDVNKEQIEMQLAPRLTELYTLQRTDNSIYGSMNQTITETLVQLKQAITSIKDLQAKAAKLPELESKLQECQKDLDQFRAANVQPVIQQ